MIDGDTGGDRLPSTSGRGDAGDRAEVFVDERGDDATGGSVDDSDDERHGVRGEVGD